MNREDVWREVRRRLGKDPDPLVWALVEEDNYVEDALEAADGGPGELVAALDAAARRYRRLEELRTAPRPKNANTAPSRSELPGDEILAILSAIMATDAAQSPFVQAFRHHVLSDRLLTEEEAGQWHVKHAETARTHAWARGPSDSLWRWDGLARTDVDESEWAVYGHVAYLTGRAADWPKAMQGLGEPNESDRILDFLNCVCDILVERYGWSRGPYDRVARFVLTGTPPPLSKGHIGTLVNRRFPEASLFIIHVLPSTSPREVMEMYSSYRRAVTHADKRHRKLMVERATLALFIAQQNDGRTWEAGMKGWNARGESLTYSDVRAFSRDAREAYARITGTPLAWKKAATARQKSMAELFHEYASLPELALLTDLPPEEILDRVFSEDAAR